MAYLTDMPATCKARATNPEFPLQLLKSISGEFDKGLNGGIFDATYVLTKLDSLTRHVEWLEGQAREEFRAQCEPEEDGERCDCFGGDCSLCCEFGPLLRNRPEVELEDHDDSEKFSSGYNGGYGQSTLEDDRD